MVEAVGSARMSGYNARREGKRDDVPAAGLTFEGKEVESVAVLEIAVFADRLYVSYVDVGSHFVASAAAAVRGVCHGCFWGVRGVYKGGDGNRRELEELGGVGVTSALEFLGEVSGTC